VFPVFLLFFFCCFFLFDFFDVISAFSLSLFIPFAKGYDAGRFGATLGWAGPALLRGVLASAAATTFINAVDWGFPSPLPTLRKVTLLLTGLDIVLEEEFRHPPPRQCSHVSENVRPPFFLGCSGTRPWPPRRFLPIVLHPLPVYEQGGPMGTPGRENLDFFWARIVVSDWTTTGKLFPHFCTFIDFFFFFIAAETQHLYRPLLPPTLYCQVGCRRSQLPAPSTIVAPDRVARFIPSFGSASGLFSGERVVTVFDLSPGSSRRFGFFPSCLFSLTSATLD